MLLSSASGIQDKELAVPGYDCGDCHQAQGWTEINLSGFDHRKTKFPLAGAHRVQNCNQCHKGESIIRKHDFKTASAECKTCHLDIHETKLGDNCAFCHNSETWTVTGKTFDHETTLFSLLGAHRFADCQDCHRQDLMIQFDYASLGCYACHQRDYEQTLIPNHKLVNFSIECEQCHGVNRVAWTASFDHNLTQFSLLGLHQPLECLKCHQEDIYDLPLLCTGCHLEEFKTASNPDHVFYGYAAEDCSSCHFEFGWTPHIFKHDLILSCESCHFPDYSQAADPPHDDESGFTLDCEQCHGNTATWEGALFDHGIISVDCVKCHQSDYNNTTDPDHAGSGLDTVCETCHISTSDWTSVDFSHNFPILTGGHQDEQQETCSSCHAQFNAPPSYSCTLSPCHGGIDNEHNEDGAWESCTIGGINYSYDPNGSDDPQCVQCHPNGNEEDCGNGNERRLGRQGWRNELKVKTKQKKN